MTTSKARRRKTMFGFSMVAWILVFASAAYACTVFKGKMTVTDPSSRVSSAQGDGGGMSHCVGTVTDGARAASGGGTSVTVAVSAGTCMGSGSLPNNTYDINFINHTAFDYISSAWKLDQVTGNCMSGTGGSSGTTSLTPAAFTITGGTGSGSATVTIPASSADTPSTERSGVCVSDSSGGSGNEVPIRIV